MRNTELFFPCPTSSKQLFAFPRVGGAKIYGGWGKRRRYWGVYYTILVWTTRYTLYLAVIERSGQTSPTVTPQSPLAIREPTGLEVVLCQGLNLETVPLHYQKDVEISGGLTNKHIKHVLRASCCLLSFEPTTSWWPSPAAVVSVSKERHKFELHRKGATLSLARRVMEPEHLLQVRIYHQAEKS